MNSALSKQFMIIYDEEEPQIKISWDGSGAVSEWLTSFRHPKIPPSLYPEKITPKAISDFCESRQPPRTRFDIVKTVSIINYWLFFVAKILK